MHLILLIEERKEPMVTHLVSVCTMAHAGVWKLASQLVPRFVAADRYTVFVPRSEVENFRTITPSDFEVMPEEQLGNGFRDDLLQETVKVANQDRFGWYFQQLLKYEAIAQSESERVVIWDADCVPVNHLRFFDSKGAPIYIPSAELNPHYFDTIFRLLGIRRIQHDSFISPGFPVPKDWFSSFLSELEKSNDNAHWSQAIIRQTDLSLGASFSEYETFGSWVANRRPGEWRFSEIAWERFGNSKFGPPEQLDIEAVVSVGRRHSIDVISFENWDRRKPSRILGLLSRLEQLRPSSKGRNLGV